MHGHEPLLKMRLAKKIPDMVFIQEHMYATDWEQYNDYPTICIKPDELVEQLDLRFLVGLAVSLSTSSETRSKELLTVCKRYCNTVAASNVYQIEGKTLFTTGFSTIWHR